MCNKKSLAAPALSYLGIGSLLILPVTSNTVLAQPGILEEVVVVARKREESLQETPIAVTALGSDQLRAAQIDNLGDLSKHAPGLTRQEGSKIAHFSIRGVGVRSPGIDLEPGVGVYVDSIYIPRNDVQLIDIIDAESVQVLRGPQGTLFGKNTAGGAILLTTKKPDEEFTGFVRGNFGDLDRQRLRAAVSGPLIEDRLAGGITIDLSKEDGYREDAFTGRDYGNMDRTSVLGQLRYLSEEAFTGDLMLFWGEIDENTSPLTCQYVTDAQLQAFTAPGNSADFRDVCDLSWELNDDEEVVHDRLPLEYTNESLLGGLTLQWELEDFTVKSISGYLHQDDIAVSEDADATNIYPISNDYEIARQFEGNGVDVDEEREFWSQEFQLLGTAFDDSVDYTFGLFYSNETIDNATNATVLGPGGYIGIPLSEEIVSVLPPRVAGFADATVRNYENTSAAIFGQAIVDLSDTWQLSVGGRYTWEEKEVDQDSYVSASTPPGAPIPREEFDALETALQDLIVNPVNPNPVGKEDWTEATYSTTLTYLIPESWSDAGIDAGIMYGSLSSGFKAGGFAAFGEDFVPFDPETLWTGEFGYKLDAWDSRIRLNGAIYYTEYDDIQIRVTRTVPRPGLPALTFSGVTNAGSATISGAELEFTILPIEGLLLGFSASYINAEYDEFEDESGTGEIIDRSDEDFAFIPEQTYSVAAQYDWDLDIGLVTARVDGHYTDQVFIGLDAIAAATEEAYLDSYTVWNFRIAYQPSMSEGLEVAGYVNNFTDEDYFGTGVATIGGIGAVGLLPGKQRTYGVEVSYSW